MQQTLEYKKITSSITVLLPSSLEKNAHTRSMIW